MRPTVFLFDIDGTLILTGGVGRRSMAGAFSTTHGPRGATALDFPFAGMTDRAIVRTGLRAVGIEAPDAAAIDRVLDAYLVRLASDMLNAAGYRVMPGVMAVLSWLAGLERVAIGLGKICHQCIQRCNRGGGKRRYFSNRRLGSERFQPFYFDLHAKTDQRPLAEQRAQCSHLGLIAAIER